MRNKRKHTFFLSNDCTHCIYTVFGCVRECKKCLMTKENRLFTDDVVVTSEDCDDVIRGIGT